MVDLAKQRRGRETFHDLSESNQEKAIEDMRERRERKFIVPGAERKMRAWDLVSVHWKLTGPDLQPPAESYNRIMACIIDHANAHDGVCNPGHACIAIETGYSVETVKRVVKWWIKHKFLETESPGLAKSLAYHPQWGLFESFWVAVEEDISAQKEEWRGSRRHASKVTKGTYGVGHTGRPTEPRSENLEEEPSPPKRTELPSEDSDPSRSLKSL